LSSKTELKFSSDNYNFDVLKNILNGSNKDETEYLAELNYLNYLKSNNEIYDSNYISSENKIDALFEKKAINRSNWRCPARNYLFLICLLNN
jgi:hypothetical protein